MSERGRIAKDLRALIPQMEEDARCHRTWQTPAAQADMAKPSQKPLAEWVGDAQWHRQWAAFYERVAAVMAAAADQLEERAVPCDPVAGTVAGDAIAKLPAWRASPPQEDET